MLLAQPLSLLPVSASTRRLLAAPASERLLLSPERLLLSPGRLLLSPERLLLSPDRLLVSPDRLALSPEPPTGPKTVAPTSHRRRDPL